MVCTRFRPVRPSYLFGLATFGIPETGLVIHDVAVLQDGPTRWVQMTSCPVVENGALVTDARGEVKHSSPLMPSDNERVPVPRRAVALPFSRGAGRQCLPYE